MLPFAVVTYKMASSINTLGVEFARQEIRGLEYHTPLTTLLNDLQLHRSLTALSLSGDASSKAPLDSTRADVENDIKKVDEVDQRLDSALHTTEKWTALRDAIRDLLDKASGLSAEESATRHSNVDRRRHRVDRTRRRCLQPDPRSRSRQEAPDRGAHQPGARVERGAGRRSWLWHHRGRHQEPDTRSSRSGWIGTPFWWRSSPARWTRR